MQQYLKPPLSSTSTCQILIVEDEYIIANDLGLILRVAGYPVLGVADSVAEALTLIARQRPDMVLLDIYLKEKKPESTWPNSWRTKGFRSSISRPMITKAYWSR